MPSENERHQPPSEWYEEYKRAAAEQFARDQVELSHARDHVREITDAERDHLREAVAAADAAMPAKSWPPTGSAPDVMWAVVDPTMIHEGYATAEGILPTGVLGTTTDETTARQSAQQRDEVFNRQRPERKHLAVEYVRKGVAERVTDRMVVAALRQAFDDEARTPGAWDSLVPVARALHVKTAGDAMRRLLTAALAACSEGDNP